MEMEIGWTTVAVDYSCGRFLCRELWLVRLGGGMAPPQVAVVCACITPDYVMLPAAQSYARGSIENCFMSSRLVSSDSKQVCHEASKIDLATLGSS